MGILCKFTILIVILKLCFHSCQSSTTTSNSTQSWTKESLAQSQNYIRNMAQSAWNAYVEYAWANEALEPVTNSSYEYWFGNGSGQTIVDSLSTLWVMNLTGEFEQGKAWVEKEFDFAKIHQEVRVHYGVTDFVGGLLSCYVLTGEKMFLDKAKLVANVFEPAYNTSTGLPFYNINPATGAPSDSKPFLSSVGLNQPEYIFLSHLTNDSEITSRLVKIQKTLTEMDKPQGLYAQLIDVQRGKFATSRASLSRAGRDFYTNLVKSYFQSGGQDREALELYCKAMDSAEKHGLIAISSRGLTYSRDIDGSRSDSWMSYLSCYLGGLFGLSSKALNEIIKSKNETIDHGRKIALERATRHGQLSVNLTETCHQAAVRTNIGLAPWTFYFNDQEDATNSNGERFNIGPELAESYFIMWRLTHQPKYRDYAWQMAQAIQTHCRTESGGYTDLNSVHAIPSEKLNYQRPAFMSGTLKFLYLTFTDDSVLPLDEWIFNTAGHPLPVCGKHSLYPQDKCNRY